MEDALAASCDGHGLQMRSGRLWVRIPTDCNVLGTHFWMLLFPLFCVDLRKTKADLIWQNKHF
jgi:hypothetical protein